MTSLIILKSMLFAKAVQEKKMIKKKDNTSCVQLQVSDLRNMCRICCSEEGKISIFNNKKYPNMPEEITQFSGLEIAQNNDFPKHICQNCHKLLLGCIKFKDLCNMSHERLSELCVKKESIKIIKNISIVAKESSKISEPASSIESTENTETESTWPCAACYKEFLNVYAYNDHLSECLELSSKSRQTVEKIKTSFLCDVCGKTLKSNAHLIAHKVIHENIFPFQCDQCPYRGRTIHLLKVHKRSHLIDKPYKCTLCPKATTTSSNLAKHIRHVHSTIKQHKCIYCDKLFSYQHDVKRHIKDIHLRQGTVECDICFKKFNTKKILHGHRLKVHKIKSSERHGRLPSYLECVSASA